MKKSILFVAAMAAVVLSSCDQNPVVAGSSYTSRCYLVNRLGEDIQLRYTVDALPGVDTLFVIPRDSACYVGSYIRQPIVILSDLSEAVREMYTGYLPLRDMEWTTKNWTTCLLTVGEQTFTICEHIEDGPFYLKNYHNPKIINDSTAQIYFDIDSAFVALLGSGE